MGREITRKSGWHRLILPGSKEWVEPGETVEGRKIDDAVSRRRAASSVTEKPATMPNRPINSDFVFFAGPDAEMRGPPLRETLEIVDERYVGEHWLARVEDGTIPPIEKIKGEPIEKLHGTPYADRGLFMICPAGNHVFARAIGSITQSGGHPGSNILHGIARDDGIIIWDGQPLFNDNVSREDPRASIINGKTYITYTRIDPRDNGEFSVGLAIMEDSSQQDKVRELGIIIGIREAGVDSKDATIFQGNDKVHMLVRLKPGIQVVSFKSMDELVETLCASTEKRDGYWLAMRNDYYYNPAKYNHLHDNTPGMAEWRAKWKALFQHKAKELVKDFKDVEFYNINYDQPYWFGTGNPPLPVEHDRRKYWLGFHHWGQVLGRLTEEGVKKKKKDGERLDDLKMYGVVATLHDYDNPTKIIAVSPIPISMPDLEIEEKRELASGQHFREHKDAVLFVKIASGARIDNAGEEPYVNLFVGVNDTYTIPERIRLNGLLDWMLKYGKFKK